MKSTRCRRSAGPAAPEAGAAQAVPAALVEPADLELEARAELEPPEPPQLEARLAKMIRMLRNSHPEEAVAAASVKVGPEVEADAAPAALRPSLSRWSKSG